MALHMAVCWKMLEVDAGRLAAYQTQALLICRTDGSHQRIKGFPLALFPFGLALGVVSWLYMYTLRCCMLAAAQDSWISFHCGLMEVVKVVSSQVAMGEE